MRRIRSYRAAPRGNSSAGIPRPGDLCETAERRLVPLGVILSEVSNANEVEGSSSRQRSRYRFRVREALLGFAVLSFQMSAKTPFAAGRHRIDICTPCNRRPRIALVHTKARSRAAKPRTR